MSPYWQSLWTLTTCTARGFLRRTKISGTTHNVFGIQVGVSISLFIRRANDKPTGRIFYFRVDEFLKRNEKFSLLESCDSYSGVKWQEKSPDRKHTWLTTGMEDDFDHCLPMGNRDLDQDNAETIFFSFSQGLQTSGDAWAYNFDRRQLATNMKRNHNYL